MVAVTAAFFRQPPLTTQGVPALDHDRSVREAVQSRDGAHLVPLVPRGKPGRWILAFAGMSGRPLIHAVTVRRSAFAAQTHSVAGP